MGDQRPTVGEINLKRTMALDYFKMHGIEGVLYEIETETQNVYTDDTNVYKEGKELPIIFQQFPDIKTLKKLGWYNQDRVDLPWIMYIPFYYPDGEKTDVRLNVLLEFASEEPSVEARRFKVEKVAGKGFSALYWVVNVIPVADEYIKNPPVAEPVDPVEPTDPDTTTDPTTTVPTPPKNNNDGYSYLDV